MTWNWNYRWQNDGLSVGEVHWVWVRKGGDHAGHELMNDTYSQFYEGGCCSDVKELPQTAEAQAARKKLVYDRFKNRFAGTANRFRNGLKVWYGENARSIGYAEAFEVCEYGSQPTKEQLRRLFPF